MYAKIPKELIDALPATVDAEREDCQAASDAVISLCLFLDSVNIQEEKNAFPALSIEGVPQWPLPHLGTGNGDQQAIMSRLNKYLAYVKRNAEAYNKALSLADPMKLEAERIQQMAPEMAETVWDLCNQLARTVAEGDLYKALDLPK